MTDRDRRNNVRVETKFEINYVHDSDYLVSFSRNISADGMFIHTNKPPEEGTVIQLTFSIGDIDKVTVDAKVAWVNKAGSTDDPGMGVQFIDPPESLKDAILHIVNRVAIIEKE